ncbi:MAG: DUF2203 family protein [Planctomycetia bacterium]|nr:DUF2203 family protein [Planctomycetia bacterium]
MLDELDNFKQPVYTLRLWSYAEAVDALPYLCVLTRALRDDWVSMHQARLVCQRALEISRRPNREDLVRREEASRDWHAAAQKFEETLTELSAIDVACFDPTQGLALIPFQQDGQLAWFLFDLFAPQHLTAWRFHTDPLDTQRPLSAMQRLRYLTPIAGE